MSRFPSYAEMCFRPVIRPNLPLEWLTRVTLSEYNAWAQSEMDCPSMGGLGRDARLRNLETQRQAREKLYQMELKKIGAGLKTFDVVSSPSNRDAVIETRYGKVRGVNTLNGRVYPDNVIRWDKYEKLTKKIMKDMTY